MARVYTIDSEQSEVSEITNEDSDSRDKCDHLDNYGCFELLKRKLKFAHRFSCPKNDPCYPLIKAIRNNNIKNIDYHLTKNNVNGYYFCRKRKSIYSLFDIILDAHDNLEHTHNDKILTLFQQIHAKGFNQSLYKIFKKENFELFDQLLTKYPEVILSPANSSLPVYIYQLYNTQKISDSFFCNIIQRLKTFYAKKFNQFQLEAIETIEQLTQTTIESIIKEENLELFQNLLKHYPEILINHIYPDGTSLCHYLYEILYCEKKITEKFFSEAILAIQNYAYQKADPVLECELDFLSERLIIGEYASSDEEGNIPNMRTNYGAIHRWSLSVSQEKLEPLDDSFHKAHFSQPNLPGQILEFGNSNLQSLQEQL